MMWLSWIVFNNMYNIDAIKRVRTKVDEILSDDFLWQDVILRHDFANTYPWNARAKDEIAFDHAMGNFWGMIAAIKLEPKRK